MFETPDLQELSSQPPDEPLAVNNLAQRVYDAYLKSETAQEHGLHGVFQDLCDIVYYTNKMSNQDNESKSDQEDQEGIDTPAHTAELLEKSIARMVSKYSFDRGETVQTINDLIELQDSVYGVVLLGRATEDDLLVPESEENRQRWQEFNQYLANLYIKAFHENDVEALPVAQLFMAMLSRPYEMQTQGTTQIGKSNEIKHLHTLNIGAYSHAAIYSLIESTPGLTAVNAPIANQPGKEHKLYGWEKSQVDMAMYDEPNNTLVLIECKGRSMTTVDGREVPKECFSVETVTTPVADKIRNQAKEELEIDGFPPNCHIKITLPTRKLYNTANPIAISPEFREQFKQQLFTGIKRAKREKASRRR